MVEENSKLLVNIFDQLRDIRLCLDGKDGVIVRLDRIEQEELRRRNRVKLALTMAATAVVGVLVNLAKDVFKF